MGIDDAPLFQRLAAAYVRGTLGSALDCADDVALFASSLDALSETQRGELVAIGRDRKIRLHRFKRTMGLPRVSKVLGALHGLAPLELLDIGTGRGAFLWPLLDSFPDLSVTAVDQLEHRVKDLVAVAAGGIVNLRALRAGATQLPFKDNAFDVVTMLEVLEHIPQVNTALHEGLRVARRFVVLSVPSKPDDNPEHIHLLDQGTMEHLLIESGAARATFEYVPGHMIAIARKAS